MSSMSNTYDHPVMFWIHSRERVEHALVQGVSQLWNGRAIIIVSRKDRPCPDISQGERSELTSPPAQLHL